MNLDASVRVIYDSLQCSMVEDYYSSIIHLVFVVQIIASICFYHSHKVPGSIGSRYGVEGRHLKKVWYEGGIPLWNDDPKIGT